MEEIGKRRSLPNFLSFLVLIVFSVFLMILVFNRGVCCADDGFFATTAKNLAGGLGYASTLHEGGSRYSLYWFDPGISSGPTVILPAALSIKIFGNTYWAPGVSHILTLTSLLILLVLLLSKETHNRWGIFFFILLFLFNNLSLLAFHFPQWYALLGEVPAVLLVILGVLVFFRSDSLNAAFLSGLFFGLASHAKLIALLGAAGFGLSVLGLSFLGRLDNEIQGWRMYIRKFLPLAVGFAVPVLLFEGWKILTMGIPGYLAYWEEYLAFFSTKGLSDQGINDFFTIIPVRLKIFPERFAVPFGSLPIMLVIAGYFSWPDRKLKQLFLVFLSMINLYTLWWFFFSTGWPRYYIICLILIIFTACLPLLTIRRGKSSAIVYPVILLLWSSMSWSRLNYPIEVIQGRLFGPNYRTQALIEVSERLSRESEGPILTQWWATAADLEYMMDEHLNFTTFRDPGIKPGKSYWIGVNQKFVINRENFLEVIDHCQSLEEIVDYLVGECIIRREGK